MVQQTLADFSDELYDMMKSNRDFHLSRIVFGKRAIEIGNIIFKKYGSDGLFDTMRMLSERVLYNEHAHQSDYFTDLRELECKWSGICQEFQC